MIMFEEMLRPGFFEEGVGLLFVCGMSEKLERVVSWSAMSIRERGLGTTLRIAASVAADFFFDLRYGTETLQAVNVDDFDTASLNRSHAVRYKASRARPFLRLLRRLRLPHDGVFVDFGSGKGRVLLLAARYGFKRVVGIEFCPQLCVRARENVEAFRRKVRLSSPIEVVEADVTAYPLRDDENVFFFYNPFDAVILRSVIERIGRSLATRPRQIWLIYSTPLYATVIEEARLFSSREVVHLGGTEFRIYSNPPQARHGSSF